MHHLYRIVPVIVLLETASRFRDEQIEVNIVTNNIGVCIYWNQAGTCLEFNGNLQIILTSRRTVHVR